MRELLHAGQLVYIVQTEAQQEILAGFVLHGPSDDLLASGGGDEFAIEQRAQDAGRLDAANVGDLRAGDGLLVGDDGKGLKGGKRETNRRLETFGEGAHHVMMLGLGGHAESARDLTNLDATLFAGVVGYKLDQNFADARAYGFVLGNFLLGLLRLAFARSGFGRVDGSRFG